MLHTHTTRTESDSSSRVSDKNSANELTLRNVKLRVLFVIVGTQMKTLHTYDSRRERKVSLAESLRATVNSNKAICK